MDNFKYQNIIINFLKNIFISYEIFKRHSIGHLNSLINEILPALQ